MGVAADWGNQMNATSIAGERYRSVSPHVPVQEKNNRLIWWSEKRQEQSKCVSRAVDRACADGRIQCFDIVTDLLV